MTVVAVSVTHFPYCGVIRIFSPCVDVLQGIIYEDEKVKWSYLGALRDSISDGEEGGGDPLEPDRLLTVGEQVSEP